MTALAQPAHEDRHLAFPPALRGFARDLTMAWLLSYDSPHTRDAYRLEINRWFAFCLEYDLDPLHARKRHGDIYKRWLELRAGGPLPPAPWPGGCRRSPPGMTTSPTGDGTAE
jgi:hypothetical protein